MTDRPTWFETTDGTIVCGHCRLRLLQAWAPGTVLMETTYGRDDRGYMTERAPTATAISSDEECRPSDFTNLGKAPWKGNPPGDRYMQCDICLGQWGPDA